MELPFTTEQFLVVFERYNLTIWPIQIIAYGLGLSAVLLTLSPRPYGDKIVSSILGVLWLWTGLVYHVRFFAPINPIAWSVISVSAALSLGIVEDLGLIVAALVGIALLYRPDRPVMPFSRWRRGYAR